MVVRSLEQALTFCLCIVFYWFVSNKSVYMLTVGYIICLVSTIISLPIPESPRLLLSKGDTEGFKKAMDMMARCNRRTIEWEKFDL